MDELNIVSGFTRTLISRMVRKILRDKTGSDIDLRFNHFKVTIVEDRACIHVDLDADISKSDLMNLTKNLV